MDKLDRFLGFSMSAMVIAIFSATPGMGGILVLFLTNDYLGKRFPSYNNVRIFGSVLSFVVVSFIQTFIYLAFLKAGIFATQ